MIEIEVSSGGAKLLQGETLTAGRVGLRCRVRFGRDWEGLRRIAVFSGACRVDVLADGEELRVPAECLEQPGGTLYIGFYGADEEGGVVIPTVWVNAGEILPGAELSEETERALGPNLLAQILGAAADAADTAAQLRADAAAGRLRGEKGEKGDPGEQGEKGEKGDPGQAGPAGAAGLSPTVQMIRRFPLDDDPGGVELTVTDGNGAHSCIISNGARGAAGACFTPAVSAQGVLSWTNDAGAANPASVDLTAAVLQALPSAVGVSF